GIGLGEAPRLGVAQDLVEAAALARHGGEDVIARAVDDPVDRRRAIPRQPLLDRAQDRDAAPDARLEAEAHAPSLGLRYDLLAVHGEERLVRRHHVLPGADGAEHEAARWLVAPDQLDDDVEARIGEQRPGVPRAPRR